MSALVSSMTGFGAASAEAPWGTIDVEARSVNARFLKVQVRLPSAWSAREADVEALTREYFERGTVFVTVRHAWPAAAADHLVNEPLVRALQSSFRRLGLDESAIPALPGVVGGDRERLTDEQWNDVRGVILGALEQLQGMRRAEGAQLARALRESCTRISALREALSARVPLVAREHLARLRQRLAVLLEGVTIDEQAVAREAALVVERADVGEELARIDAHLQQMQEILRNGGTIGRRLEFLAQELQREANTLGAKSIDAPMSQSVVDMKLEVERVREQAANLE